MLAYWDTDLNKSVDFFLNPICILLVVCPSTIAVCIAIYANKILFKLHVIYVISSNSLGQMQTRMEFLLLFKDYFIKKLLTKENQIIFTFK